MNAALYESIVCDAALFLVILGVAWFLIKEHYVMCMFLSAIGFFAVVLNPGTYHFLPESAITVLAYMGLVCSAASLLMYFVSDYRQTGHAQRSRR